MADTKISALTDGAAAELTDVIAAVRGAGNVKLTLAQVQSLVSGDGLPTGMTYASPATTTGDAVLDILGTFNGSGQTLTGLRLDVTDTASAADSLLLDLSVGGSQKAAIDKTGNAFLGGGVFIKGQSNSGLDYLSFNLCLVHEGVSRLVVTSFCTSLFSGQYFGWRNASSAIATVDLRLYRDDANTLAQRNGTNAQTFRLYGTYSDGSNYRRLATSMSPAGVAEIKPEGAGTGASGNVLHISGLPTSNPGPGILWNNAGTPAIGT